MGRERKKVRSTQSAKVPDRQTFGVRREHLILLAIFVLAIFIRLNGDASIPYHYDPGKNIVYARAVLQSFPLVPQINPYFNLGEYYDYQVLFPYLVAFIHVVSGISLVAITEWLAILSGAALCLTVYYLSCELFHNTTAALISAFLVAASKIQLLAYMNYYPQILAMTLIPLAFVFLIRFVNSRNIRDLALVALLSSLIVLASYIAAFVYFLIVCVSLGIWSIRERETGKTLLFILVTTVSLLTFFWLPMAWRLSTTKFIFAAQKAILSQSSLGFTNVPWTLVSYLSASGIAVVTIIMGGIAFYLLRPIQWDFKKLLLAVWLTLAFLLMESYLIRPILWVDRYAQFLDIAVLLLTGVLFSLFITKLNTLEQLKFPYAGYLLVLLLILPLYGAIHVDTLYGKWGYPSDIAALDYMQGLPPDTLVVAPPGVQSFWVSALSGVRVLSGESSQMVGRHYLGDGDSNLIINSADVNQKMDLIRKYGVNYIFIPYHTSVYLTWNPDLNTAGINAFNNSEYFRVEKYFADDYGSTVLIKVRENLTPRYTDTETNGSVTILGYLVSGLTFIGCVYLCMAKKFPGLPGKKEV
jgi:hypothetical protein